MIRRPGIAAVAVASLLAVSASADDLPEPTGNFSASLVISVDRDATEVFVRARDDLSRGRTAAGIRKLQQLLDRSDNVLIERAGTFVDVQEAANQSLADLKPADREVYERLVRDAAQQAWEGAIAPLDADGLRRLTDQYRHAPAGRNATRLLAMLALDRGDLLVARGWAEFITLHFGTAELPEVLSRLRQPDSEPQVEDTDPPLEVESGDQPNWSYDLNIAGNAAVLIGGALAELDAQAMTPVLTCRPLVVGNRLITRTLRGILCVDTSTGRQLWEQPIDAYVARLARGPGSLSNPIRADQISAVFLRRLIRDSLQDELSTDGQRVFTLVTPDSSANVDPERPANQLLAIDIKTGVTDWQRGGTAERDQPRRKRRPPSANGEPRFFLGPPLVDGEQLLVLAQSGQKVELVSLDAGTGGVLWSIGVGQAVRDLWAREARALESPAEDRERRSIACRLSRSGSLVLCPTGAGAVACIDTFRRRLLWVHRYARDDLATRPVEAGDDTHFREMPIRDTFPTATAWIWGNTGVCLAPDADRILGFNLTTGQLVWSRPRRDAFEVLAGNVGTLLAVGAGDVTALGFADGAVQWSIPTPRPTGRGDLHDGRLLLPMSHSQPLLLNLKDGRVMNDAADPHVADSVTLATHPPPGLRPVSLNNLVVSDGRVFEQSVTRLQRVAISQSDGMSQPAPKPTLAEVLLPLAHWRSRADAYVGPWRQLDSRVLLMDGLLLRTLEICGLKSTIDQHALALVQQWQQARESGDSRQAAVRRAELTELPPQRFYITSPDGLHTARLDRWLGETPETATSGSPDLGDSQQPAAQPSTRWPDRAPVVTEIETHSGIPTFLRLPLTIGPDSPWQDVTVEMDWQARSLQFHHAAQSRPTTILLPRERGMFRLEPRFLHGWAPRDVLVLRLGNELIAFQFVDGKLPRTSLWPADNQTLPLWGIQPPLVSALHEVSELATLTWDRSATGFEDVFGRSFGDVGPVCDKYVCYQQRGHLIALDMQTGQELWRRSRLPVGTRAVGDDETVVLLNANSPRLTVLDAHDGRTLREWSLEQPAGSAQRQPGLPFVPDLVDGTVAVVVDSASETGQFLQVIDLATGQMLWEQNLPVKTQLFEAGENRLGLVVPGANGQSADLQFLELVTGAVLHAERIDQPDEEFSVTAWSDRQRQYVIVSGKVTDVGLLNARQIRGGLDRQPVNGRLYAFDKQTLQLDWSEQLVNVAFPSTQPRHVPLLVINDLVLPAGKQAPVGRLVCLDSRTGETLVSLSQSAHAYYALQANAAAARIDIRLRGRTVRLDYAPDSHGEGEAPDEPPNDPPPPE